MSRLTLVKHGGGLVHDDGDVLALGDEVERGVHGRGAVAHDGDLVADFGGEDVLDGHHVGRAARGKAGGHDNAAGCLDQHVGGLGAHEVGVDLLAGDDGHAANLLLALQVGVEVGDVLVLALDCSGEGQLAAQVALLLVERDAVSAQGRDACGLHAGCAAAHDHDVLGVAVERGQGGAVGHGGRESTHARGVNAAVLVEVALLVEVEVAVQAAVARADLVDLAFAQLVDVVRVGVERAGHVVEVDLAVLQGLLKEVRGMCRVHIGDRAHGDAHGRLDLCGNLKHEAAAGVRAVEQALPVAGEVELRGVAGVAVDAVAREVQVAGELAGVVAVRPDAHVQRVGAGRLELLAQLDVLLDGREALVLAQVHVVGLDAVDEDLHGEVLAAGALDALDDLAHEARAVLKALRAVLVLAVVAVARQERLTDVVAGGVELDGVEASVLEHDGDVDEVLLHLLDLVEREVVGLGAGELGRRGGVESAEGGAHEAQLVAAHAARLVDRGSHLVEDGVACVAHLVGSRVVGHEACVVLDPHEVAAALDELDVLVDDALVGDLGQVERAGGRLHHAVAELELAEVPGREERRLGEVLDGVGAPVARVVGVELGERLIDVGLVLGCGLCGRGGLCSGRGSLGQRCAGDAECAGGSRGGAGSLEEAPTRDVLLHVYPILSLGGCEPGMLGIGRACPAGERPSLGPSHGVHSGADGGKTLH